ncbi:hypothetical protein [Amycolatopsis sp. GM8]|uniref:hypothetical protein n=1 Tax=Amycolatopsis sp. GM8 TaxID=2896530 RepID=UPI001F449556|nr:hypothetical protein [Amycolatopsis sp. GM8]
MAAARFQMFQATTDRVDWRFLSANNRSIARSVHDFPDAYACLNSLTELIKGLDGANVVTVRNGQGMWHWQLRAGAVALAVSSRQYQRRIRAHAAGGGFLTLAKQVHDVTGLQLVSFDRADT